jgi:hypothetical protein
VGLFWIWTGYVFEYGRVLQTLMMRLIWLNINVYFRSVRRIAKKRLVASSYSFIRPSVRLYVRKKQLVSQKTDFGEIWYLGFPPPPKICRENTSFIRMLQAQRVLYMKTCSHLRKTLAEFFLEWEIFWSPPSLLCNACQACICGSRAFETWINYLTSIRC